MTTDRLNAKVRELLRQARVHVVEMRDAQHGRQKHADEPSFFVRVDRVVALGERAPSRRQRHHRIERNLGERRPDLHTGDERRARAAEDAESGHRHIVAERVGDEVDVVTELGERADAVELAERCAAGLEKRLGRDHQQAHG